MGLLSGLSNLGLGKLENADIYETEEKNVEPKQSEVKQEVVFNEADVLFDKSCECPVCGKAFTYKAVRTGKAKLVSQDMDLRPKYDKFDPLKYDVVVCTACGYSALARYLQPLPQPVVKLLKENVCGKVKGVSDKAVFSYDDAIQRYQLALACAIVKKAKDSEKAYICLKLAWVVRGKKEELDLDDPNYDELMARLNADETEALKTAFEGFIAARQKESFPIAGMDELTVDYILAVLASKLQHFDIAQKLIASILTSKVANNRIKDKARDLKEQVKLEMSMAKEMNS